MPCPTSRAPRRLMSRSLLAVALLSGLSWQAQAAEKITVFAAASLTNALQEIATQYQKDHPVEVVASYASSSVLARQIEQGAPANLFISADQQWMDYAQQKQQIVNNSRYTLLGNELVLIAPQPSAQAEVKIDKQTPWVSLLSGGRLAVGDPDHVPAGIYAKQALQSLGAWTALEPTLARGNNVRAAMALVERQEAPLGIVYGSDAKASAKVKVVGTFPAESHPPVEYPMAIVRDHQNSATQAFYDYLKGPQAAVVFKQYGFSPR